jgi:hypothetical protein
MADPAGSPGAETPAGAGETVGSVAELYLGNILFAIERCAMGLDAEGKPMDAAFYRGIGRKLAEAYRAGRGASD